MQKLPGSEISVKFKEFNLPDDFPLTFYTRKPSTQNTTKFHFHNGIEIGFCIEGSGLFFVHNKILPYNAGDVVVLFPDQPHIAHSFKEDPSQWHYLTFDSERMFQDMGITQYEPVADLLYKEHRVPNIITKEGNPDLCDLIRLIFTELTTDLPGYQYTVKALLWAVLLKLTRLSNSSGTVWNEFYQSGNNYAVITPAINYMTQNYKKTISIPLLSQMCYVSPSHFNRTFKKIMDCTPFEYLIQIRVRMAASLLKSNDEPISEVALEVGYPSISSFNRHFKMFNSVTPRDYRKRFR